MAFVAKVLDAGLKKRLVELETLVKREKIEAICKELDKLTKSNNLTNLNNFLEYMFLACDSDQDWASKKKSQVIIHCLEITMPEETFNRKTSQKLNALIRCSEIKPEHLVKIIDVLLLNIEKKTNKNLSWQILLPTVYNKIRDVTSDFDYNTQILNKLLAMKWTQENIVILAEMFSELKLSPVENQKIVVKSTECLKWLEPEIIPHLVPQILHLRTNKPYYLLLRLQQYYGSHLYVCNSYVGSIYSESITHNSEQENTNGLIESESKILSYINESLHCPNVQGYINYLKKANLFGVILHPFNLSLLVTVAHQHDIRELLDLVKTAIVRYYVDAELRDRCFYREMIARRCDLETIIRNTMDANKKNCEDISEGMLQLALVLLTSNVQIGQEAIISKLCQVATFILIRIGENKSSMLNQVFAGLATSYFVGRNTALIMESFTCIATRFKFNIGQNIKQVMKDFHDYLSLPDDEVNAYLEVLMDLNKYIPSIQQRIIRVKHNTKADKHQIQLKLVIYHLKLLKYLKVTSNEELLSDTSSSQGSLSTQLTLSRSSNLSGLMFSNEAICRDAINELHSVLVWPSLEAKQHLFKGLLDVATNNPELATSLSMFTWDVFYEMPMRLDTLPPICFEDIGKFIDNEWFPVITISHLIMAMGSLLPIDDLDDHHNYFGVIATEMGKCEVEHFILHQDITLTDSTPESIEQLYIFHEAINTYDSFITFYFLSWSPQSEHNEQMILNLFKARKRLVDYLITYQKSKKKKDANSTTSTTCTTQSVGNTKKLNVPISIIPLHCLDRIIQLLYCEYNDSVKWTGANTGTLIKVNVPFHHYIMESFISTLESTKPTMKSTPEKIQYLKEHFDTIETFLFKYCVLQHEQLLEFDVHTAELTLEAFLQLQMNKMYLIGKENVGVNINYTEQDSESCNKMEKLTTYITAYKKIFEDFSNVAEDDKIAIIVVNSIAFFADQIPISEKQYADKLINWMKDVCRKKSVTSKIAANNFIAGMIATSMRFTSSALILKLIVSALGASYDWISENVDFDKCEMAMINSSTSSAILQTVINELKNHHDQISSIMKRIRLEYDYFALLKEDATTKDHDEVKRKERKVCSKLKDVVTILTCINYLAVPKHISTQTELILKSTISVLKLLTTLANYFLATSTAINVAFQSANFSELVRCTIKELVPAVSENIKAVEEAQSERRQSKQTKYKDVTKTIPNVTLAVESFKKTIMQISVKTKVEVCDSLGTGNMRGFKVRLGNVQIVDGGERDVSESSSETTISTINEVDSVILDASHPAVPKRHRKK